MKKREMIHFEKISVAYKQYLIEHNVECLINVFIGFERELKEYFSTNTQIHGGILVKPIIGHAQITTSLQSRRIEAYSLLKHNRAKRSRILSSLRKLDSLYGLDFSIEEFPSMGIFKFESTEWQYYNKDFLAAYLNYLLTVEMYPVAPIVVYGIDTHLDPSSARHLTQLMVDDAKKNDRQLLIFPYHPTSLDGLDLTDREQGLYVIKRKKSLQPRVKRVKLKEDHPSVPLSEAWNGGMIGGLPKL